MNSPAEGTPPADPAIGSRLGWALALGLIGLTVVALHHRQLVQPAIWQDDFQILNGSYTWDATVANFWAAHNEHVMPLGRLSTWALIQAVGRPSLLPSAAAWHGVLAVLIGVGLVYLFVRRELGHPLWGVFAAALFGVSTQYREAVFWFSASFAILALDTILLALLAAQGFRLTGQVGYLVACSVASALAPCWFASGILAGPFCCLYLLYPSNTMNLSRRLAQSLAPLAGTAAFVLVGLLRNLDHILHLEHWQNKTATEAFRPGAGLVSTVRSLVDNLMLGTIGITGVNCGPLVVTCGVLLLAAGAVVWWSLAPCRRLLALGLAMILLSYWLIYSARAEWGYERTSQWGRYQLLAHLGLVLFFVGALPRWHGWGLLDGTARPWLKVLLVAGAFAGLLLTQFPRAVPTYDFPHQGIALRFIEDMDRHCQKHAIAADTARRLMHPLRVEMAPGDFDGWQWLRANPTTPVGDAEARSLLPADWLQPSAGQAP